MDDGNFNPRSREGSDEVNEDSIDIPMISTHAPARGATLVYCKHNREIEISTHAPARGATFVPPCHSSQLTYFNPRSRKGSDQVYGYLLLILVISTHAPARGATVEFINVEVMNIFQPTLPRGERQFKSAYRP